jgi:PhnB protein
MATVNVYLNFDGNCKEAFDFYQSVFGGEFPYVGTYGEMPLQEGAPALPEEHKNRIMHISLPIGEGTVLMGADTGGAWAEKVEFGNNVSISINTTNRDEADSIFNALSKNGKVSMPMEVTFWNAYFGMFTDQFGIHWMVNCDLPSEGSDENQATTSAS